MLSGYGLETRSVLRSYLVLRFRIHYTRIRIQHFQKVLDPDPEVQNDTFSKNFQSSLIFVSLLSN
jgi:hypothetical protein